MTYAPQFAQGFPPPGATVLPARPPQTTPSYAPRPSTVAAAPRQPVVRAKAADDSSADALAEAPRRREPLLAIPAPEQLGVGASRSGDVDWNNVATRLKALGAISWQPRHLPQGGFRFLVLLPTAEPNRIQHIEAEAQSEAEAVQKALERAEQLHR